MSICHSCGGVIGRDCFNPAECAQITAQMAMQYQHGQCESCARSDCYIADLKAEIADLQEQLREAGRNAAEREQQMREELRDALAEQSWQRRGGGW